MGASATISEYLRKRGYESSSGRLPDSWKSLKTGPSFEGGDSQRLSRSGSFLQAQSKYDPSRCKRHYAWWKPKEAIVKQGLSQLT